MRKHSPSLILVLEDAHLRAILAERFEREGWSTVQAEDAEDGERRALKARPDIFFIEIHKDAPSIAKLLKRWKALPTLMKAKIVLYFAKAERGHLNEALEAGASQVILSGTLPPKDIVKSLTRLLSEKKNV